jgi:hypothetical protein
MALANANPSLDKVGVLEIAKQLPPQWHVGMTGQHLAGRGRSCEVGCVRSYEMARRSQKLGIDGHSSVTEVLLLRTERGC